jgi:hypothetical protein
MLNNFQEMTGINQYLQENIKKKNIVIIINFDVAVESSLFAFLSISLNQRSSVLRRNKSY